MLLDADRYEAFAADLLAWFDRHARPMPWRNSENAYHVWLSEIMLQQTQITTAIPYFQRFIEAYPTVEALAAAPIDEVLKRWEGLGYYTRARNLHRAAGQVAAAGGQFPTNAVGLLTLPGVGRYTAGAIASIAFRERVPVLDGNVIRVLSRLYDIPDRVDTNAAVRRLWEMAGALVPEARPGDYNQAIMDLGREICRPRKPLCGSCPVRAYCAAFANGTQAERPVKAGKAATPHYDMAAAILRNAAGDLLIAQRPAEGLLGGLWEFPADRCLPDEAPAACIVRALRDKLDIEAQAGDFLIRVPHAFSHFRITVHVYECRLISGTPTLQDARGYTDYRWAALDTLDQFAFARADRKVIEFLRQANERLC